MARAAKMNDNDLSLRDDVMRPADGSMQSMGPRRRIMSACGERRAMDPARGLFEEAAGEHLEFFGQVG